MKAVKDNNVTITGGGIEPVKMGISQRHEDQVMILNILTNTLYTDKISAVLREYGCNGADANVEAGRGDTPIEVRLPTYLEPYVVIRDFGDGMTEKQIYQVFTQLGRSTKRNSNDVTGMLGIGSKAGFAYGDSFMVTSYTKGTKVIYNCFRDAGAPKLAKMHEEATESPDGMEIKVPVKQQDIDQFAETAERVYRYFRVQPIIHGKSINLTRDGAEFQGTNWRFTGTGTSVAVMGNVGYDLSSDALGSQTGFQSIDTLLDAGIELDFTIGDVEIASNREGLQYSDYTKAAVLARLKVVEAEVAAILTEQIAGAPTLWDAHRRYGEIFERRGHIEPLRALVEGKVSWHKPNSEEHHTITSARMKLFNQDEDENSLTVYTFERGGSKQVGRLGYAGNVYASNKTVLCINDLETKKIPQLRLLGFFHANSDAQRLTIFTYTSKAAQKKHQKKYGLTGAPFIKFSSVVPAVSWSGANGGPSQHKAKHTAGAFTFNHNNVSYRNKVKSAAWTPVKVDAEDGEGVYVSIDKFKVDQPGGGVQDAYYFVDDVKEFLRHQFIKGPVYGFKRKWLKSHTLGKGWVKLEDAVQAKLDEWNEKKKVMQVLADYDAADSHYIKLPTELLKEIDATAPLGQYITTYNTMLDTGKLTHEFLKFIDSNSGAPWLKKPETPEPSHNLEAMRDAAFGHYPMLALLDNTGKSEVTVVAGYIKLVDGQP